MRIAGVGAVALLFAMATAGAQPAPVDHQASAIITGTVVDSLRGGPLGGAIVEVVGAAGRLASTDSMGRFRIDSVPAGVHRVAVYHPFLDTLDLSVHSPPITFAPGATVTVVLATPSPTALLRLYCPSDRLVAGRPPSVVVGHVLQADDTRPLAGVTVTISWRDVVRVDKRETRTSDGGGFHLCAPPGTTRVSIDAARGGVRTGQVLLTLQPGGIAVTSLQLAVDTARAVAIGRVIGPHGEPITGAVVVLTGGDARAVSRDSGQFTLAGLPAGTQTLQVMSLGYAVTTLSVNLTPGTPWRGTIQLQAAPPTIATVHVTADRIAAAYASIGFTQRRANGLGTFMNTDEIEHKHPLKTSDLFSAVPGLYLDRTFNPPILVGSRGRTSLTGASGACVNLYVDGHHVVPPPRTDTLTGAPLPFTPIRMDEEVSLSDIAAIETYTSDDAPPQFTPAGESCPTIVVWTKSALGL